ncbi:hypothetical protein BDU57DRAFT_448159, partial [Ampelomyces quisqualis]
VAAIGVALDAFTWMLPHYVVWRLQLRPAHKMAITAIFALGLLNIVIGGLRISALAEVAYSNDVTYGVGTTLLWSMAQISTGIIVACCPYLRPAFELVMPERLTRVSTPISSPYLPRRDSIIVTTRIEIHDTFSAPLAPAVFDPPFLVAYHDVHTDPRAPIFKVEQGPVCDESQSTAHCDGCFRRCSCRS